MSEPKVAVVTGASAGIGKELAKLLLADGWRVIGTGRNPERSAAASAEISNCLAHGGSFTMLRGDFDSMAEVQRLAAEISALTPRIDVLYNNAGGWRDTRYVTVDGLEATMASNHLAPFLLTRELLPLLKAAAEGQPEGAVRVIATSSSGHAACPAIDFGDLMGERNFVAGGIYCQAKLANILFTRELNRRLSGSGVIAQAMHPGRVDSNFASHGDPGMRAYMENAENDPADKPARTLFWMATAPEAGLPGGRYFYECAEEKPAPQAMDDAAAAKLWQVSGDILARLGF